MEFLNCPKSNNLKRLLDVKMELQVEASKNGRFGNRIDLYLMLLHGEQLVETFGIEPWNENNIKREKLFFPVQWIVRGNVDGQMSFFWLFPVKLTSEISTVRTVQRCHRLVWFNITKTFMIVLVTWTMCEYNAVSSKIIPVALFEKKHFFCKMQVVVTFCHFLQWSFHGFVNNFWTNWARNLRLVPSESSWFVDAETFFVC